MKILFIGGTGIISSACAQLAIERGHELYLLNRGQTTKRPVPEGAHLLHGDIRDRESARAALGDHSFDAVVDWIAFTPDHIETDLDLFRGRARGSTSSSARRRPTRRRRRGVPIAESTPLDNPVWLYSRNKIACEERLMRAYREEKFPMTVVRPSHTYDKTLCPFRGGYTMIDRMRKGQAGHRARRRHVAVDADAPQGLRAGFRRAARAHSGDRRCVPHHLRRGADVESDLPAHGARGGRRSRSWCTCRRS